MEVHHAGQRRGESEAVLDATVAVEPHQRVPLRHIVQEAGVKQLQQYHLMNILNAGNLQALSSIGAHQIRWNMILILLILDLFPLKDCWGGLALYVTGSLFFKFIQCFGDFLEILQDEERIGCRDKVPVKVGFEFAFRILLDLSGSSCFIPLGIA